MIGGMCAAAPAVAEQQASSALAHGSVLALSWQRRPGCCCALAGAVPGEACSACAHAWCVSHAVCACTGAACEGHAKEMQGSVSVGMGGALLSRSAHVMLVSRKLTVRQRLGFGFEHFGPGAASSDAGVCGAGALSCAVSPSFSTRSSCACEHVPSGVGCSLRLFSCWTQSCVSESYALYKAVRSSVQCSTCYTVQAVLVRQPKPPYALSHVCPCPRNFAPPSTSHRPIKSNRMCMVASQLALEPAKPGHSCQRDCSPVCACTHSSAPLKLFVFVHGNWLAHPATQ